MSRQAVNAGDGVHEIAFGSQRIRCEVTYGTRTRIRVAVYPDLTVRVRAPRKCPLDEILEWTRRRAAWILRQQSHFAQFLPRPSAKRYIAGETYRYLGRQYRLKIDQGRPQSVRLQGQFLRVTSIDRGDSERTRQLVEGWYRDRSKEVFERRLESCLQIAGRFGIHRPKVRRRRMTRRWGSCKVSGGILLNTELVKAPVHCVDYVIMHELCHLRVPNHGQGFYHLVAQMMPDWGRRKARLEQFTP